jgi:hypothetical protein
MDRVPTQRTASAEDAEGSGAGAGEVPAIEDAAGDRLRAIARPRIVRPEMDPDAARWLPRASRVTVGARKADETMRIRAGVCVQAENAIVCERRWTLTRTSGLAGRRTAPSSPARHGWEAATPDLQG